VQIVSLLHEEARHIPALNRALSSSERFAQFQTSFSRIKIPGPLALKLAVMQEDRPELFQHSLIVAMLCTVLGVLDELPLGHVHALALAGIFHDIGELCLDPAMLAPGHHMDKDERRYLYTHPITGYLMLRDFAEFPRETALAIWRHHERADGTGYPYGLHGDQIDVLSRYLAVAEFVASLLKRNSVDRRINIKLRLNLNKFDANVVGIMCSLFAEAKTTETPVPDETFLINRLARAGKLFEGWQSFRCTLSPAVIEEISYFDERMDSLRMMVLEPGFDQCQLEDLLPTEGRVDSEIREELTVLLDELAWQMQDLAKALEQKLAERGWSLPVSRRPDFLAWMTQVSEFSGQ
jgi:hypothetical protein